MQTGSVYIGTAFSSLAQFWLDLLSLVTGACAQMSNKETEAVWCLTTVRLAVLLVLSARCHPHDVC